MTQAYHLDQQIGNGKNSLSFLELKKLGAQGKILYKGQKVVVDPFSSLDVYFEVENNRVTGFWKLGTQKGPLHLCDWVDSAWVLDKGIIRPISGEITSYWVKQAALPPREMDAPALHAFLEKAEGEIVVERNSELAAVEPVPFLVLNCRHGGFADLWFDYGAFGNVAAHEGVRSWRNPELEKSWEKDLLETDFIKKTVEKSHYYCPLDKVAKSLTFLMEIGWTIIDAKGRKVVRQKGAELDADITEDKIAIRAKVHYGDHAVDLKDLVGAFNRRDNFVELSPSTVALIDRDHFEQQWGDITVEGTQLRKNRFGLLEPLMQFAVHEDLKEKIGRLARCAPSASVEPGKGFQGTLFPYQKEGLQWLKFLDEGGFGGLLADEMGLGKTVQVLALFSLLTMQRPSLVVVPTSLLFNWQREIEKFLPGLEVYSHQGKQRLQEIDALQKKPIIIVSYAMLRIDSDLLEQIDYQAIVLDEGQTIKNPDSKIAACCCRLRSDFRLVITGTPIENRIEDLWSIFHFLQPDLLGEKRAFQAEAQMAQMGVQYLERIKRKVRPFILRRKKEQVALQLPPKLEQTVYVEMTQSEREIYEKWLQSTKQGLLKKISLDGASAHRMEILEAILRLRQICAHPWLVEERKEEETAALSGKFDRVIADLEEVVLEKGKVLVYSQFTKMLKLLEGEVRQKGWKYVYLDGSTKDRETIVRQFQDDPETQIFLISLKAGGVGLNLTAADYVFLYDPWWNDAVEKQAIDRAHRLGKQGTVIARRYISALTIEEKILRLKAHKTTLSDQFLEGEDSMGQFSIDDLLGLLV